MGEGHEQAKILGNQELVAAYQTADEADRAAAGQDVMGRLLSKVDLADCAEMPLTRQNGEALTNAEGKPLQARDYLEVASKHKGASEAIFNFVTLPESDPKFPATKAAMAGLMKMYLFLDPLDKAQE